MAFLLLCFSLSISARNSSCGPVTLLSTDITVDTLEMDKKHGELLFFFPDGKPVPNPSNVYCFLTEETSHFNFECSELFFLLNPNDKKPHEITCDLTISDEKSLTSERYHHIAKMSIDSLSSFYHQNAFTLPAGKYRLTLMITGSFDDKVDNNFGFIDEGKVIMQSRTSMIPYPDTSIPVSLPTQYRINISIEAQRIQPEESPLPAIPSPDIFPADTLPMHPGKNAVSVFQSYQGEKIAGNLSINYYDDLGRPDQTVQQAFTPDRKDLTTMQEYDLWGRKSRNWLPIATGRNNGESVSADSYKALTTQIYEGDNCPYTSLAYEASPCEQVIRQYGPGSQWHEKEKAVKMDYFTNVASNDMLRCFSFSITDRGNESLSIEAVQGYEDGSLLIVRTEDEDGNTLFEFKDRTDRTVLERRIEAKAANKQMLDTYYIYDNLGNLRAVLPPMLTADMSVGVLSPSLIDQYAYLYKYVRTSHPVAVKLPGSDWEYRAYDSENRLVFTQNGEERKRAEWKFSIPDNLGRVCLEGLCKNTIDPFGISSGTEDIRCNYAGDISYYKGYMVKGMTLVSPVIRLVNYYDNYHFIVAGEGLSKADFDYSPQEGFGERYASAKGLLTGTFTESLSDSEECAGTWKVMYYDDRNQVIQNIASNHLGGIAKDYFSYDFTGNILSHLRDYADATNPAWQELYTYTYDHAARLTQVKHRLNDQLEVILAANEYDELCRLKRTTLNNGSLPSEYAYNIRNWTTEIKNPKFTQKLHYTDGEGIPCYNGNISSMTWKTDLTERGYRFTYDGLSRLKDATYSERRNLAIHPNRFNEQVTGYDRNGNILGLKRFGQTAENDYGLIDNLSLSYHGNQLKAVNDSAVSSAYGNGFEFKDGTKKEVEYSYDANGNLTQDLNKKISEIQYNCLNLPRRIQFEDGSSISYLYDAAGTKLRVVHHIEGKTTTTDYCGNAIYENGVLHKLLTEQGYITLPDTTYHYFIQDHQGNNRIVVDQNGTVEEVNHYYPFGGVFANSTSVQPYKYNGKELDRSNGLDWYDYGARHYDAAIGRWHAVDPMAEKYYGITPYAYCDNNPIKNIDLDGRDWYLYGATGQLYYNRDLNQNQITFNDNSYVRVGANNMLGDMTDVVEKSFSFEESASLAQTNGYNINPIQQLQSEESREQSYPTGKNSVSITTGKIEIVNEKYGIFAANKDKVVGVKTEPLFTKSLDNISGTIDILLTGGKKTDYIERNYITYEKSKTEDKVYNVIGRFFGIMSTVTTGKQDYRTVNVYNNWNAYSRATKGIGRMLDYKK